MGANEDVAQLRGAAAGHSSLSQSLLLGDMLEAMLILSTGYPAYKQLQPRPPSLLLLTPKHQSCCHGRRQGPLQTAYLSPPQAVKQAQQMCNKKQQQVALDVVHIQSCGMVCCRCL